MAAADVKVPQAPERAQLVLGVTEALRNLEGLCPGLADLGNGPSLYSAMPSAASSFISRCVSRPARPLSRRAPARPGGALLH